MLYFYLKLYTLNSNLVPLSIQMMFSPIKLCGPIVIDMLVTVETERTQFGTAFRLLTSITKGSARIIETLKIQPTESTRTCKIFEVSIWVHRLDAGVSTLPCMPAYTSVHASVGLRVSLLSVCLAA